MKKLIAGLLAVFVGVASAQQPPPVQSLSKSLGVVVFPAKGQNAQQQSQDEGECYAWARTDTGVDPMAPAAPPQEQAAAPPPAQPAAGPDGSRLRGAARGAAAGAVVGEIADNDASKGAEIGAAVGVMKGGAESRRKKAEAQSQAQAQATQQQQATEQQAAAAKQQQVQLFNKGFSACLQAKGYTVN